jgi:sugar/nucleoside kinase (ribokinase family)
VTKRTTDHGGNVATALVAVARLGGRAGFIGWLGDEPERPIKVAGASSSGTASTYPWRHARFDAAPIRSVITVGPDGDRFIAYDDDVLHGTSDALPDDADAGPGLLIDGYATHSETVVARARALGPCRDSRYRMDGRCRDRPNSHLC